MNSGVTIDYDAGKSAKEMLLQQATPAGRASLVRLQKNEFQLGVVESEG